MRICEAALEKDLPMLGICRGMQVMNIVKGGGIYQDIGVQAGTTLKHIQQAPRSYGTHSIFVEDNTLLTDLWENKRTVVNSLHHQSCSTLGEGFIVSARSADGLIEAIEHKDNRFAVGVQWHPEAMKTEEMGLLFSAFLKAAAEYQQARR
jgi:putative glutamine amidotransferase